ncbi:MAG: membrane-associated HD superfamily phosphohydrolase [Flavobacterium sp.]|jgi:membrane-associated HD superfamily phosphohydrolase
MKNIILTILLAVGLQYFFLVSVHDHDKGAYQNTALVFYSIISIFMLVFYKYKIKVVNILIALFLGFIITFIFNVKSSYLFVFNSNYVAIDGAFNFDKSDKVNYNVVEGDFDYGYIYKVNLLSNQEFVNAHIECNKYLFWETGYLSGYNPIFLKDFKETNVFSDKVVLFLKITLYSFVEMLLKSLFSNLPVFLGLYFFFKKKKNISFWTYKL